MFSSVQSLSRVRLFATPWTAAHQASLSITNSWSLYKLRFSKRFCPWAKLKLTATPRFSFPEGVGVVCRREGGRRWEPAAGHRALPLLCEQPCPLLHTASLLCGGGVMEHPSRRRKPGVQQAATSLCPSPEGHTRGATLSSQEALAALWTAGRGLSYVCPALPTRLPFLSTPHAPRKPPSLGRALPGRIVES